MDPNLLLSNFIFLLFAGSVEVGVVRKVLLVYIYFHPSVITTYLKNYWAEVLQLIGTKENEKFFLQWSNVLSKPFWEFVDPLKARPLNSFVAWKVFYWIAGFFVSAFLIQRWVAKYQEEKRKNVFKDIFYYLFFVFKDVFSSLMPSAFLLPPKEGETKEGETKKEDSKH